MGINSLNEIVNFNNSFKTAVNLYLSLNKIDKVLNYIPTKSSIILLDDYMNSVINNKEQSTLLIGPYGKGKSHLLLVFLAILSLERNDENTKVVEKIINDFSKVDDDTIAEKIRLLWNKKRFLPVIINDTNGDLNQSFIAALNDALKRDGLTDLAPDTYYSIAIDRIEEWKSSFKDTYKQFVKELKKDKIDIADFIAELKRYSKVALQTFIEIYPKITAGSMFNPLAVSEVLPLYKSVSEKLVEEKNYAGIYIVFDEFSKFIEGLNGRNVGNNMKLLQDMCELSNESSNAQIFITMVAHKSIKEYGKYLSSDIINAFTGIEGRIIEKFFVTSSKNNYELIRHAILKDEAKLKKLDNYKMFFGEEASSKYRTIPVFDKVFDKKDFDEIVLKGCFPLNPVATYILLNISEKVAQNERTLFTFISNDEPNSMARYVAEHTKDKEWTIGAGQIYDYFSGLFKKEISNELVHNIWLGAETALLQCQTDEEKDIIKSIALIQIVNKEEELKANKKYTSLALNTDNYENVIDELIERQIIYVKESTGVLAFKTKAGIELRNEIKKQRKLKGDNVNYSHILEEISDKHFVIPRRYNIDNYITRYFYHEYMDVEFFLSIDNADAFFDSKKICDGKVLTLYSFNKINQEEVKNHLIELNNNRLIIVLPGKKITTGKQLKEYEILDDIKNNHIFMSDNDILKKEIPILEEDLINVVRSELLQIYVDDKKCKVLYFDGKELQKYGAGEEELSVNKCCELVYSRSPKINNEIINRISISSAQTKKARLNIIAEILASGGNVDENFYAGTNQEATIFRSLFMRTGIINDSTECGLKEVLNHIEKFIDSCCDMRISFKDIILKITSEPYGMRLGVVSIYLAYELSKRHEDLVVYYADNEIQLTADVIVNICDKPDDYSLFVPREDKEREDYIKNLNKLFNVEESRNLTENRIKNIVICMQRWYRSLPQVTRNLAKLELNKKNDRNMQVIKNVLQKVEYNPYEILFVTIPEEFEMSEYSDIYSSIKKCKKHFDEYYVEMNKIVISKIYEVFDKSKSQDLYHIMKDWYAKQSVVSKKALLDGEVTGLMNCIESLEAYSDEEVAQAIAKAVTGVYLDTWRNELFDEFTDVLSNLKSKIENIKDDKESTRHELYFTGVDGKEIKSYYEPVTEGTGVILRNILEETLEDFDDLSENDRVGILLEMIEKIVRKK